MHFYSLTRIESKFCNNEQFFHGMERASHTAPSLLTASLIMCPWSGTDPKSTKWIGH